MEWLTMIQWTPYAVGIGIGLLSCLAFLLSDKPMGCSTAFARTSGMLESLLKGKRFLRRLITVNSSRRWIGNGCWCSE